MAQEAKLGAGFWARFTTQFLGAFNDNLFKTTGDRLERGQTGLDQVLRTGSPRRPAPLAEAQP